MATGTLNGLPVERASVSIPKWGALLGDLQVASGELLSGPVQLELAGASFACTVIAAGIYQERGWYRVAGGAGGWGKAIDPVEIRNEAGVKLSQALGAAARACGETLGTITDRRLGPAYATPRAEASLGLSLLAPEAWYVDEAGVTQIGARPATDFTKPFVVEDHRPDRARLTIAAEDIAGLVPGATVNGMAVASVRHELTPERIRTHLWGELGGIGDRLVGAFGKLVAYFTRRSFYLGRYEYRIDTATPTHLDLRPATSSLGLPSLANVPVRVGVAGVSGDPIIGSLCEVQFLNGDPTRPVVVGFDAPVAAEQGRVLRSNDKIGIVGLTSPAGPVTATVGATIISLDPTVVIPGAPGVGYSRAQA